MTKRLLLIGVVLALVLSLVVPAAAMATPHEEEHQDQDKVTHESKKEAEQEFSAQGSITALSAGDVVPAGKSGWWIVRSRDIFGSLTGDLNGNFVLTYKARVDATQAGKFSGRLKMDQDGLAIKIKGRSQPYEMVPFGGGYLPKLSISGTWKMSRGFHGKGDFQAWFVFIPEFDQAGNMHIGQIVDSAIDMTGRWRP